MFCQVNDGIANLMSGLVKDMKEKENLMIVFNKLIKDVANLMSGLVKDMKDI